MKFQLYKYIGDNKQLRANKIKLKPCLISNPQNINNFYKFNFLSKLHASPVLGLDF